MRGEQGLCCVTPNAPTVLHNQVRGQKGRKLYFKAISAFAQPVLEGMVIALCALALGVCLLSEEGY